MLQIGPHAIDPPVFSAPMAGFTNYAYRELLRRFGGVGLIATEMISARGAFHAYKEGRDELGRLWGVKEEPRPIAVQIWDNEPTTMVEVSRRLVGEYGVSVVDINFGCPARDVSEKAESGSWLLDHPARIGQIVEQLVEACGPVPVTAKIRLGRTAETITAIEVAKTVEEAGGAAITVHGRTAAQMYSGEADWEAIASIKPHLKRIPLIGNGDIRSPEQAVRALREYDVDGIMIGRAGLGRPWLFSQIAAALRGEDIPPEPGIDRQREILFGHYHMLLEQMDEHSATVLMRKYACSYAQGKPNCRKFRGLISRVADRNEFERIVEEHYPRESDEPDLC